MDRITFGTKTLNNRRPRVDRFVAPRESFPEMCRRIARCSRGERLPDDIWYAKYLQKKKYTNYLDEVFGLEPLKAHESSELQESYSSPWPCVPRKKSCLSSADSVLDLPTYSHAAFPELLDWSNDNILVAALGRNYHKWSWRTQNLMSKGLTRHPIQCCKFDPKGELLALGTDMKTVEIHRNSISKWIDGYNCRCCKVETCSITAIDWSPTGNSFATGCSRGTVMSITRDAKYITSRRAIRGAIYVLRVSPDARYLAAAAVNGTAVLVMTWPNLDLFASLGSDWCIKTISWHPWRSALLGIGTETINLHARIALWDAPSAKIKETHLGRSAYSIDTMLFSQKTGEMVLSMWNLERALNNLKSCSQLVVLSDFDTVVDQWGEGKSGLDRVRTMVFSPDGTKLATATADEDLIIWNFLPEDAKKKKKKESRMFSAIPEYIDEVTYGISLR